MGNFGLAEYLNILWFRKRYFIAVALAIVVLSVGFALRWSNYRSQATVEIAPADIAAGAAAPMGMSADRTEALADLRVSRLQQKVLSTPSLIEIITKFDLYGASRQSVTPIAEIAGGMRKKIKVELVTSTLANPSTPQGGVSAIAFNLSFDYPSPLLAQQVTNELVSKFLDEDLKDRRKQAQETSAFLGAQIKALEASMQEQEKNIADYRTAHTETAPELLQFNLQTAESLTLNIQSLEQQLTSNEGTLGALRGQLASTDPYSRVISDGQVLTTPTIQLKALKTQYATFSAQYGPTHPDVVKLRRQIAALKKEVGDSDETLPDSAEIKSKIEDTKTNLAAAEKTYGADHPDVVALRKQLATLEAALADATSTDRLNGIRKDADNPAYLQVVAQLRGAEEQRKALEAQKTSLLAQQEKYRRAVTQNPVVMQKMAELTRDYDNSQLRYRELKEKKMAADMSETIEQDRNGQKLVVVNPPELPTHTHPSRKLFILGGFTVALLGGLSVVALMQIIAQSVVSPRHLAMLSGVAPLVSIPHIYTEAERQDLRKKRRLSIMAGTATVLVTALLFSNVDTPLDVRWIEFSRWLGLS